MVGGYDFEDSKFDRAMQAMRQTGSSFKVYVYAEALDQGASPFDTVVDAPVSFHSGGLIYSPHNYDEKFEGRITLRRALADSRNVPAVRLLDKVGIENVIGLARKFGVYCIPGRWDPYRTALHPAGHVVRRSRSRRAPSERHGRDSTRCCANHG